MAMGAGGLIMRVQLNPNVGIAPAPRLDQIAELVIRMALGMMHQGFGESDDVAGQQVGGDMG